MIVLVLRLVVTMLAFKGADMLLNSFDIAGGIRSLLLLALVFGVLNWIVKPILVFFSIPLLILTIGLFYFVINALILYLTAELLPGTIQATSFGIVAASVIISLLHWLLSIVFRLRKRH